MVVAALCPVSVVYLDALQPDRDAVQMENTVKLDLVVVLQVVVLP